MLTVHLRPYVSCRTEVSNISLFNISVRGFHFVVFFFISFDFVVEISRHGFFNMKDDPSLRNTENGSERKLNISGKLRM